MSLDYTATPVGHDPLESHKDWPVEGIAELVWHAERLLNRGKYPATRLRLQSGDRVIEVDWAEPEVVATGAKPAETPAAEPVAEQATEDAAEQVRAPLVGTFYRAPSPDADPFVSVGDTVEEGQQVAIVEAMKLMNPITAQVSGTVVAVPVADGEMVEYDQVLIEISTHEAESGE